MAKSHAMARCQGYIASVRKGKKKKSTKKAIRCNQFIFWQPQQATITIPIIAIHSFRKL